MKIAVVVVAGAAMANDDDDGGGGGGGRVIAWSQIALSDQIKSRLRATPSHKHRMGKAKGSLHLSIMSEKDLSQ